LFSRLTLDAADRALLAELDREQQKPQRQPVYIGLVHHPIKDREGQLITTAVTNLDVHDLSRASRTYGIARYFVITPIDAQRELVGTILEHWIEGSGLKRVPERGDALSRCQTLASIADAKAAITAECGVAPQVLVTAARLPDGRPATAFAEARELLRDARVPSLILFGTGHGLASSVLEGADFALPPIRPGTYNHLSVRAACAIILDRLFGDEGA
jgi:hypothetical protein